MLLHLILSFVFLELRITMTPKWKWFFQCAMDSNISLFKSCLFSGNHGSFIMTNHCQNQQSRNNTSLHLSRYPVSVLWWDRWETDTVIWAQQMCQRKKDFKWSSNGEVVSPKLIPLLPERGSVHRQVASPPKNIHLSIPYIFLKTHFWRRLVLKSDVTLHTEHSAWQSVMWLILSLACEINSSV